MDEELLEAGGQHVLCLLVATITDVGHQHLALEPPADPVVNTSGFAPVFLLKIFLKVQSHIESISKTGKNTNHTRQDTYRDLDISVRLVADELLSSLLHNFGFCEGPEGCHGD